MKLKTLQSVPYLPRPNTLQGGKVPDSNLPTVTRREEQFIIGTKCQSCEHLRLTTFYSGPNGCSVWIDDLYRVATSTGDERSVWWYYESPAFVELLKEWNTTVVVLEGCRHSCLRRDRFWKERRRKLETVWSWTVEDEADLTWRERRRQS